MFILLLLIIPLKSFSQEDIVFDHITVAEGLTQSVVTTIYRDSKDFMWFGTLNGVSRYDGKNIKSFEPVADDSTSLSAGLVRVVCEDKDQNLWIGTVNGLNLYDYRKENFSVILNDPANQNSLLDNVIINISVDTDGSLWVVTQKGLNKYNPETGEFTHFLLPPVGEVKTPQIEASFTQNSDTIYLFSSCKIFRFLTTDSSFKEAVADIQTNEVNAILVDNAFNIWVGTENDGAYRISRSGVKTHFYPGDKIHSGIRSISVKSINEDSKKNVWLSTRDGLYRLNNDQKTFTRYQNEYGKPNSLLSSYARVFYEDKQGVIWVGTVGGINKFDPERLRFRHLKTSISSEGSDSGTLFSNDNIIWSFYRDNRDYLWVGSMRILLSYIPFDKVGKENFRSAVFYMNGRRVIPPFNSVLEVKGDKNNNLWLGTDNGLYYYNTSSLTLKQYLYQPDNVNSLSDNIIASIVVQGDSVLWIGTSNGLSRFVPSKERFTNYYNNPADSTSLVSNRINYLYLDNKQNLWILASGGLSCVSLESMTALSGQKIRFRNMRSDNIYRDKSFNEIFSLAKVSENNYWFGTDNGLFMMDSTLKVKAHFSIPEGLPNKIVNQILEDSKGQLWISTENGITCFDPATKIFRNFFVRDGLQANEFNSNSSLKDKDGCFFFGGINGFNMFHPDSIKVSQYSPRVVLTSLEIFNKPLEVGQEVNGVLLTESIYEAKEIKLNHRQNFFSIEFTALDYTNPEKIQYEYKLEGFDEGWVFCKNIPSAHYTNVKPGKYIFKVRATNSDGVWSKNLAQLRITITPPFWQTVMFYLFSGLLFILLIYLIYKARVKALERDKRLLEDEVQKRTYEISVIYQDLKKSNSFINSVISNATYGITVINREGSIIMANPAVSLLTGYSHQELLNMNFRDLTPEKWHESDKVIMESLSKEKRIYNEKEYKRKDGSVFQVAISSSYIEDYDFPAYVNIIRDITERVANERELKEYRTNLEALVEERTADLITAKENAEKADRLKTAFLSNISHEIRTPMNSIVGFSDLLRTQSCDASQVNDYLEQIAAGANDLLCIVTNIVEISKISANDINITLHKINFSKMINEIYSGFVNKARLKGLDFNLEYSSFFKDLFILSDESKLSASIKHLLDNALKFTQEGFVKLGFSLSGDNIEVCVQDSGIGISPELQSDIFEPFKQADITFSRAYGGTGLGLTISKAYIEKLGGKIWLESTQGEGSRFFFSFPLIKCDEHAVNEHKAQVKISKLNLLIVEDEDMNYYYLSEILKKRSQNIFRAKDGYSAIEQCRNNQQINLVLMDIKLPGINGLEATTEIRKFRPDLPIIAQTAYTLVGDLEKALSAGCNDYISKPIDIERLYAIINNYLKD